MTFWDWLDKGSDGADALMAILALLAMGIFIRLSRGER